MFKAEQKFAQGNFELALNGDDNTMGFEEIIDTYGSKAGEAVYLYAGASALQPSASSRSTTARTRSSSPAPRPVSATPM